MTRFFLPKEKRLVMRDRDERLKAGSGVSRRLGVRHVAPLLVALIVLIAWHGWAADTAVPSADQAPEPVRLRLMLAWQPQAQFAGYYLARERGFYRAAGIEAEILGGGPERSPLAALRSGEADLAILWLATAIKARAAGVPLVNVAQVLPRSSLVLVARADSGIQGLDDLEGRRVAVWRGDTGLAVEALLRAHRLAVRRIPQSSTVNLFLRGAVDVMSATLYNEYHLLLDAGLEPEDLRVVRLADGGIDFPEDGLYVLEDTWRERRAPIEAFIAATRSGWEEAFADPEAAVDVVLRYQRAARIPANRIHQRWMLAQMRAAMGEPGPGGWEWQLSAEDLERVARTLYRLDLIADLPADLDRLRGH